MKHLILSILFFSAAQFSFSQTDISLGIFAGPTYSSFSFVNSEGVDQSERYETSELKTFGAVLNIQKSKHTFRPSLQFRQGGSRATIGGTPMTWKLNYIDLQAAYLFELLNNDFVSLKLGAGGYAGYLAGGEQTIGTKSYSLNEQEVFSPIDFGANAMLNTEFSITKTLNFFVEYQIGLGLSQIENDGTEQQTKNNYHAFKAGLSFNLK